MNFAATVLVWLALLAGQQPSQWLAAGGHRSRLRGDHTAVAAHTHFIDTDTCGPFLMV